MTLTLQSAREATERGEALPLLRHKNVVGSDEFRAILDRRGVKRAERSVVPDCEDPDGHSVLKAHVDDGFGWCGACKSVVPCA